VSAFIDEHREHFGVEPICTTLGTSASAYHERAKGDRSARAIEDERLLERIAEVHERNYHAYGYRRTWIALRRQGEPVGRGRVQRLMRQAGIQGAKRRGKPWRTTKPDPKAGRRPDLVERDFQRHRAGPTLGRRLHLPALLGGDELLRLRDRRLQPPRRRLAARLPHAPDLVLDALRMALGQRDRGADFELVARTDRGSQYTSADYTQELDDHGVLASVGSVGDAYDNAMAESFVDTFKTELVADRSWRSRSQLELAVVEYVSWFNHERLHESLGDIPPVEFEDLYVRQGSTEHPLLNWKPTKTVSVKPGPAHPRKWGLSDA